MKLIIENFKEKAKQILGTSFLCIAFLLTQYGCNKLVKIPEPINTITTGETFSTNANALSAISAIYSDMSNGGNGLEYANGGITIVAGQSADELEQFGNVSPYETNQILSNDGWVYGGFWAPAYYDIFMANSVIEGLQSSTSITADTKRQLTGEAKFLRAFCYFYLTNFFGDIPLVTSTSFETNSLMARTPSALVYKQIIEDLNSAQLLLASDYSASGGQRVRANLWAATALLARTYLYESKWDSAIAQATSVINERDLFGLCGTLDSVFLANNSEAILQLIPVSTNTSYGTWEGYSLIPYQGQAPYYNITNQLLTSFQAGDNRKIHWIDSIQYSGSTYYFPFKYKVQMEQSSSNIIENYTLLRLAEQYLIRAEAEANLNQLGPAITDLDAIRARAGLPPLSPSLSQSEVLDSVMQERRIELFAEWGNRWLDLKRTGQATATLDTLPYKYWTLDAQLYPIPFSEIQTDPNLKQNPGYN